jgi:hypothetical protein
VPDAFRLPIAQIRPRGHDLTMLAEPTAYEARYQWTPFIRWAIAGDVAVVLIGALLPMPLVIRVLVIVVFGYFGLVSLTLVLSRRIAFRADQTGITLGGGPFRYRSTTCFFPWADIRRIIIWQRHIPCTIWRWTLFSIPIRYIGLQRRTNAPHISRDGTGRLDRPGFTAPMPGIAAGAARNITAWMLNTDQLTAALAAYAPNVPVEPGNGRTAAL